MINFSPKSSIILIRFICSIHIFEIKNSRCSSRISSPITQNLILYLSIVQVDKIFPGNTNTCGELRDLPISRKQFAGNPLIGTIPVIVYIVSRPYNLVFFRDIPIELAGEILELSASL